MRITENKSCKDQEFSDGIYMMKERHSYMMKREMHGSTVTTLLGRLAQEHELFYYKTLSKSPKEIYESSSRICFYDTLWEYFQYRKELKPEHVAACLQEPDILQALYGLYLKREYLRVATWEDIEELLDVEADLRKQKGN